jgi:uncharacterized RDD family membrane protein YckC
MSSTPSPGPSPEGSQPGAPTTQPTWGAPPAASQPPPVAWERPETPAGPAPGIEFAPHGARLVAYILDGIIVTIIIVAFVGIGFAVLGSGATMVGNRIIDVTRSAAIGSAIIFIVGTIVALLYFPFFWARGGTTIGMRPFHLRVVRDRDGGRIGWGTAILRLIGLWVAGAVFYIGYIWVFVDKRHRGWQDLIAGTVVIKEG